MKRLAALVLSSLVFGFAAVARQALRLHRAQRVKARLRRRPKLTPPRMPIFRTLRMKSSPK